MKRISVSEFKAETGARADEAEAARAEREKGERQRVRQELECRAAGVASIVAASFLSVAFTDFPESVGLSSANGHNAGLGLALAGGKWRIEGSLDVLRKAKIYGFAMGATRSFASYALSAMGVKHSPEAHARICGMLEWEPGKFREAASFIPAHVLSAMAGLGDGLFEMVEARDEADRQAFFREFFEAAAENGAAFDDAPCRGAEPALHALARRGHVEFMRAALQAGYLRTNVPHGSGTAAHAAVEAGKLGSLRCLQRQGEDIEVVDAEGNTLLHRAARLVGSEHPDKASEIARYLVGQGLDPEARNAVGRTASELAWDMAAADGARDVSDDARHAFDRALGLGAPAPAM